MSLIGGLNPLPAVQRGLGAIASAGGSILDKAVGVLPTDLHFKPKLPPYTPLPPAARVAAEQRSSGLTYPQTRIEHDTGDPAEPVNLVVTGTRQEVLEALEAGGWTKAAELDAISGLKTAATFLNRVTHFHRVFDWNFEASPVSDMYRNGEPSEMAFNKNNSHNQGRDHLRVFDTGRRDSLGRPIWDVAATRDIGLHIDLASRRGGHATDHHVDPERDMVMADLLSGGQVQDWHVAKGEMSEAERAALAQEYTTDGKVYLVDLKPRPGLRQPEPGNSLADRVFDRAPGPIKSAAYWVDEKLTSLFHSVE